MVGQILHQLKSIERLFVQIYILHLEAILIL